VKLNRVHGIPCLIIDDESMITFREEWVQVLRSLPYEQFGDFFHSEVYPTLSDKEKKIWNKTTISNPTLQSAINAFFSSYQ